MKRRGFLQLLAAAGVGAGAAGRSGVTRAQADEATGDVDSYFLEPGDLDADEQALITEYVGYQEQLQQGAGAVMPRGGRPRRAPSYRFLHWDGELGSASGRLVGPLSVKPSLRAARAYSVNAQVLGFSPSATEWRSTRGALTIELRARLGGELMTWLYAQEFEAGAGASTVGLDYVGQRNGAPDPVVTDEPSVGLRIQLMRQPRRAQILSKVFKIWSVVTGLALGGAAGPLGATRAAATLVRLPRMLPESVAFSQALFGSVTEDEPVWRSGFNTYALSPGAGRLAVAPGFWVVIDEGTDVDLRGVVLDDMGGRAALARDGAVIEANHLVLSLEISETSLPGYVFPDRGVRERSDVMPKDIPPGDGET